MKHFQIINASKPNLKLIEEMNSRSSFGRFWYRCNFRVYRIRRRLWQGDVISVRLGAVGVMHPHSRKMSKFWSHYAHFLLHTFVQNCLCLSTPATIKALLFDKYTHLISRDIQHVQSNTYSYPNTLS